MIKIYNDSFPNQEIIKIVNYDPYKDPSFNFIKNNYKKYKNNKFVLKGEKDSYKDDLSRYQGYLIDKISGLDIKDYSYVGLGIEYEGYTIFDLPTLLL